MVLQTNIDPDFINEGFLGNVSNDGIKVDKKSILIRGNIMLLTQYWITMKTLYIYTYARKIRNLK